MAITKKSVKQIDASKTNPVVVQNCVFNGKAAPTNKFDAQAMCSLASAISENAKALKANADALISASKLMERRYGLETGVKITQQDH